MSVKQMKNLLFSLLNSTYQAENLFTSSKPDHTSKHASRRNITTWLWLFANILMYGRICEMWKEDYSQFLHFHWGESRISRICSSFLESSSQTNIYSKYRVEGLDRTEVFEHFFNDRIQSCMYMVPNILNIHKFLKWMVPNCLPKSVFSLQNVYLFISCSSGQQLTTFCSCSTVVVYLLLAHHNYGCIVIIVIYFTLVI